MSIQIHREHCYFVGIPILFYSADSRIQPHSKALTKVEKGMKTDWVVLVVQLKKFNIKQESLGKSDVGRAR